MIFYAPLWLAYPITGVQSQSWDTWVTVAMILWGAKRET